MQPRHSMCAAEIYDEWREKGARSVGRARMSDGAVYSYDRAEAGHLGRITRLPTHTLRRRLKYQHSTPRTAPTLRSSLCCCIETDRRGTARRAMLHRYSSWQPCLTDTGTRMPYAITVGDCTFPLKLVSNPCLLLTPVLN